jgi:hypothetical protein
MGSLRKHIQDKEDTKLPAWSPDTETATENPPTRHFDRERREMVIAFRDQAEAYIGRTIPKPSKVDAAAINESKALVAEAINVYDSALDGLDECDPKVRANVETRTKTWELFLMTRQKLAPDKRTDNHHLQVLAERMVEQWGIFGRLCKAMATSTPLSESNKNGRARRALAKEIEAIPDLNQRLKMREEYARHIDRERVKEREEYRVQQEKESVRKRALFRSQQADAAAKQMPSAEADATPTQPFKKQKSMIRSAVEVILGTHKGPDGHGGLSVHPSRVAMVDELNAVLASEFPDGRMHPTDILESTKLELMWAEEAEMRPHALALLNKAKQLHAVAAQTVTVCATTQPGAFFKAAFPPTAGSSADVEPPPSNSNVDDAELDDGSALVDTAGGKPVVG